MDKFKGIPGALEPKFIGPICVGIGTVGDIYIMTANSILPDDDVQYEKNKEQIEADMRLYADSKELLAFAIDFVEKVDSGRARSTDSYNKAKVAIKKALED